MEYGKGENEIEMEIREWRFQIPVSSGQIRLGELDVGRRTWDILSGFFQHFFAEIHANIFPSVSALLQLPGHAPVPASQVQDGGASRHITQHSFYARLHLAARGRKRGGELLIECLVQGNESLCDIGVHSWII
jgi:hypothetical protein